MREGARISVVIPALNEAQSIGNVLDAIPDWVDEIVVGDNGSTDGTPELAEVHGARVVHEARRGYGSACLRAMAALNEPDIVVFLDADFSDHPEQMDRLVDPILRGEAELVIGSRVLGDAEPGALTPQARFGNRLACFLMRLFWGVQHTDLGPFRAIRYSTLQGLAMADPNYGWTVEMQIKAALTGAVAIEAPVDYRRRIGRSKISGTVRGVLGAGYKILTTIFVAAFRFHVLRQRSGTGEKRLIIFTRYPVPGETKTRLIPELGAEGAAKLQRDMTEHALQSARRGGASALEVQYTGGTHEQMQEWLGKDPKFHEQIGNDLGERMAKALTQAFEVGAEKAVIIGIDCPEITPGIHRAAFEALDRHDVVLGPATDGGYYLVGLRKAARDIALPQLFEDIEWGTERVFESTLTKIKALHLDLWQLAPLDDIDRPEDLPVWERARTETSESPSKPSISIIIPTLNEEPYIEATLHPLTAEGDVEIIVVDGGSTDATKEIALRKGARVYRCDGGRAAQMNYGSAKALGETLLFLHADTLLPKGFAAHVEKALRPTATIAGAFEFATESTGIQMRAIAAVANLRSKWLHLPYGDQAIFLRKHTFRELGGYRPLPIMEDFELVRRAARKGRIAIAPAKAITSGRRWRALGPWRTTLRNQMAVLMYFLGFAPERIAAYYNRSRGID